MTYGANPSYSIHETSHDELDTGQLPLVSEPIVIASGSGPLKRGTVLGKITATGKYTISTAAAVDGSETPVGVLTHDVIAADADVNTAQYVHGQFILEGLTLGEGHDFDSIKSAWDGTPRYIVKSS